MELAGISASDGARSTSDGRPKSRTGRWTNRPHMVRACHRLCMCHVYSPWITRRWEQLKGEKRWET